MAEIRPDVHARFLKVLQRADARAERERKTFLKPNRREQQEKMQWKAVPIRRRKGSMEDLLATVPDINEW